MNILYLTTEGFDTPNPCSQLVMVLIRELLKKGNKVHLIQSRRTKTYDDIPEMLINMDGFSVDTINRRVVPKRSFVRRYLNEFHWAFQSFAKWRKIKKNVDVVIIQSCPTATYQLLLLNWFCRKPIIYNVYDMWPGNLIESGITKSKLLVCFFKLIQRIGYSCCTRIMVMSDDMKELMLKEKVDEKKITVVQSWYDDENVFSVCDEDNKFSKKYNIRKDKFIVQFAGSIGYSFDYMTFFNVAKTLRDNNAIEFHIIGTGAFLEDFQQLVQQSELNNIRFFPIQPIEDVRYVYSACDVELIPLAKGLIGVGVPSKTPLLMACEKVIINSVEKESSYYKLFEEKEIGIAVPQGEYKQIAQVIELLVINTEKYKRMSKAALEYAKKHYSSSSCIGVIDDLLHECVRSRL